MTPDNLEDFRIMFPGARGRKLAWSPHQFQAGMEIASRTFYGEGVLDEVTPIAGKIVAIEDGGVRLDDRFCPWQNLSVPPSIQGGNGYAVEIIKGSA